MYYFQSVAILRMLERECDNDVLWSGPMGPKQGVVKESPRLIMCWVVRCMHIITIHLNPTNRQSCLIGTTLRPYVE